VRRENQHALIQLGVALATGIAAYLVAPRIHSTAQHREFVDFFVASASVIAALLIALAVEARSARSAPLRHSAPRCPPGGSTVCCLR